MNQVKAARKLQAESIIKNLEKRNMTAYYCEDADQCREKVLELIPEGSVISWGGSMSIHECGVTQALKDRGDCEVLDRTKYITPQQQKEFAVKTFMSDYFLMSTNAITLDGELINIDGTGNRVASLIYGPGHVVVITGMNKVVPDVKQGFDRVRNVASPPNTIRLGKNTPCSNTGKCGDCMSPDCICNQIVVTRRSREKERIIVILVNENLGF